MNISTLTARTLAQELVRSGLRHVVICPGSRSAPLAYAFGELERQGLVTAHVRIDERDAGFLALGLAKGARLAGHEQPVAVVTTSGTAVANLHPAVLEASYSYLPLLLLTADRPARLRATGANQTIDDQSRVLTDVRLAIDLPVGDADTTLAAEAAAIAAERSVRAALGEGFAVGKPAGPVQLNVQFDVPLVPDRDDFPWDTGLSDDVTPAGVVGSVPLDPVLGGALAALSAASTVILAGDDFGLGQDRLGNLAERLDLPILAEPSSPLFTHDNAVGAHPDVLTRIEFLRNKIRTVLVAGKPTLFRPDAKLVADSDVTVVRVQPDLDRVDAAVWDEAAARAQQEKEAGRWLASWRLAGASRVADAMGDLVAKLEAGEHGGTDEFAQLTAPVLQAPGTALLASSSVIRYADRVTQRAATVVASRGLAGIDGLVSTAVGMAKALDSVRQSGLPVRLLIGDLALLHDAGGLLRMSDEQPAPVQIFVLNDNGGRIFAGLEHGQDYLAPYFGKFFATPHGRAFGDLAREYGWDYERIAAVDDVTRIVDSGRPGVFEIPLPPVLG